TMHGGIPCIVSSIQGSVAYCKVRAFWNTELGTGLAVVGAAQAANLKQFDTAVRHSVAGFNFIYADDAGHIAYWHTGTIPIRARGHDPRLPVPGDGRFDWRGFLSPTLWPSVVDPKQGWVANWNNKPAFNWPDAGDGTLWGTTQRVGEPMSLLRMSGRLTYTDLWHIARTTGQTDLRAALGFKRFLTSVQPKTALERQAIDIVKRWNGTAFFPGGACGAQVCSPAFPIMEAWFKAMEARAGAAVFGPVVGGPDTADAVRAFTRTPGTTSPEFEFFDDYDQFMFDMLSGRARGADYVQNVGALSRAALDDAIAQLTKQQGSDPTKWRAPLPQISFMALDVGTIGTIPWENRGTWGQAVELP
ncbi:MAG TPA: penicillin acylase family protein, partial [Actinomycetota bacterium]|nr:penicillin acylase family protein [Actinomycetota bacterium]